MKTFWSKDEEDLLIELRLKGLPALIISQEFKKRGLERNVDQITGKLRSLKIRNSFSNTHEYSKFAINAKSKVVGVIGDTHCPFMHKNYVEFLLDTFNEWGVNEVVHVGDEVDFHALSKYDPDPNGRSSGDELKQAKTQLESLYRAFPDVKVCTSNHTARPFKKAFESGIPVECLKSYSEILHAPKGWVWKDKWIIDDVVYIHGEGYSGSLGHLKAAKDARRNLVLGHIHSHAGVAYSTTEFEQVWGMNVGCGVDREAYAFSYGKIYASKPTLGVGIVDNGVPHFIPMR